MNKWGELRATSTCSSHPFPILSPGVLTVAGY